WARTSVTADRQRVRSVEADEVGIPDSETVRRALPERPSPDTFLAELDEILTSLQKKATGPVRVGR
ncbi:MAG: hypothetical protein L3K02_07615, partial [Thermoplasmata archaeon]|nr:hypothetical protein [Thermoplasmata archaeon]